MNTQGLSTIEEGIEDIKAGKILIVVDNEDRENEGDFIVAAEKVTPEIVNFMITNGRGVLCAPLTTSRCKELELEPMTQKNTSSPINSLVFLAKLSTCAAVKVCPFL